MLTLLKEDEFNLKEEPKVTYIVLVRDNKIRKILILKTYNDTIRDLVYRRYQKEVIVEEKASLIVNSTQVEEKALIRLNLVFTK